MLEAENGPDALTVAACQDGAIHLLLTDLLMPGMNGMELALAINARRPGTPVLYMSGSDPETVREWLGGDSIVLRKPFLRDQLLQRVGELMDRPATQAARSEPADHRREQIRQVQSVGELRAAVSKAHQELLHECQACTAKLEEFNPWGTPGSDRAQAVPEAAGKARRAAQQYLSALRALSDFARNMHADIAYATEALLLGNCGYVLKSSVADELTKAIRAEREPGVERLTTRQREVLQSLAEGRTTKEVAHLLSVSRKTVEFHKYRIMQELGVRTTAGLVRSAMALGLVR